MISLPFRNAFGFDAADCAEFAVALAFLLLALMPVFRWIAARRYWSLALLAGLPVALRMALLPWHPAPVPAGADDFSYLLLGDTLAHFRLANATHPMHRFFEAVFVLQEPAYASIYPLGQGLALAVGQLLFAQPWVGVVLPVAAFCGLLYWMLRAWTTPLWALAGGLLAVCEFGPLSQWMNLYWGGGLSAAAGCLIFGAIPRLGAGEGKRRDAAFLGLGLAIQLLTRPFEFALLLPLVGGWLVGSGRGRLTWRLAAPIAGPVLACGLLMLLQNHAVTRSWTTLPYQLSRYEYGVPASFTFQSNPAPHRPLTAEQRLDYEAQSAIHGDGRESFVSYVERLGERVRFLRFFVLAPLYLALPFFLFRLREGRYLWVSVILLGLVLGTNFYPYFYPHYVAVATSLLVLVSIAALEWMSRWVMGRRAARILLALCAAHFLFQYGAAFVDGGDAEGRAGIARRLQQMPGRHLVFVRYAPRHMFHEWIHNAAEIDAARVVWAADLGAAEDEQLLRYYPERTAWVVEPDARPVRLTRVKP